MNEITQCIKLLTLINCLLYAKVDRIPTVSKVLYC